MKFGLFMGIWENPDAEHDQHKILHQVVDYMVRAEELGYVSTFLTEHHFTGLPQIPSSLTVLAYLAARTKTLRLGTAVTILPWHNPLLLAEDMGTIDLLSNGRLDFGVGRGFRYTECRGFGIPGEELPARFDEALEVLRKAWVAKGRFSHHGKYWNFDDAVIDPGFYQKPHPPIWVSAASQGSIERTVALNYNLLLAQFGDAENIGTRIRWFKEATEALGRPYDPMRIGVTRAFHLTDSEAETRAALDHHYHVLANNRKLSTPPEGAGGVYRAPVASGNADDTWLIGTRDQIIRRLYSLKAQGAEYIMLLDTAGDVRGLERFMTEIAPIFMDPEMALARA